MALEFVPLSPDMAEEWDDLVYHSDDGWLFCFSFWQWLITGISQWNLTDYSFAVYENREMMSIMPLQFRDGILFSNAYGPGGPAVKAGTPEKHRNRLLQGIFEHVQQIADKTGAAKIEVSTSSLSQRCLNNLRGVNFLVHYGFRDVSTHTFIVNLQQSESEIWSNLTTEGRRCVKLARQAGYTVERGCWREMIEEYYRIHQETYHRTGANPHLRDYFQGIASSVAERGHSVLWAGRDPAGRPVAFHNCARFGKTSSYWTGCCETAHLKSEINYLLFWHALMGAKEDGCQWYESGEVFLNTREEKLRGLSNFKKQFGGEIHRLFRGEIVLPSFKQFLLKGPRQVRRALSQVLNTKMKTAIKHCARSTYGLAKRTYQPSLRVRKQVVNLLYPPIPFIKPYWGEDEKRIGFLEMPPEDDGTIEKFKDTFCSKINLDDNALIIPTGSGRTALQLALGVLKAEFPDRGKVILPSYGCSGTFEPVVKNGLMPVFVDIDKNLLPSVDQIKKQLCSEVLACLLVHLTGKKMDTEEIIHTAKQYGVITIEDCCQNLGGQMSWMSKGLKSDLAVYSFGIGKNVMATAGGALATRILQEKFESKRRELLPEDPLLAKKRFVYFYNKFSASKIRESIPAGKSDMALRNHYNYVSINPVDAAILIEQLKKLEQLIEIRKTNAKRIIEKLFLFPSLFSVQSPENHIYTKLSVRLPNERLRAKFEAFLASRGIEAEKMYTPLHLRNFNVPFQSGVLTMTEKIYPLVVNVPVRPNLTELEINRTAERIEKFGRLHG